PPSDSSPVPYTTLFRSTESFADVVDRLPAEALPGFVSGVKGKLFEIELAEHFNNGGLPDGLYADLAGSATQSGWDTRILDEQGQDRKSTRLNSSHVKIS